MKIGLALSGGGAFASAHIGVLKALEENNVQIDYIAGTSMGAIVAALYASSFTPAEIERIMKTFDYREITNNYLLNLIYGRTKVLDPSLLSMIKQIPDGIISGMMLEKNFENVLRRRKVYAIGDVHIPLAIPAIDLNTGQSVYFVSDKTKLIPSREVIYDDDVPLCSAVRASMSYPVFFKPKRLKSLRLVDGGLKESIPVDVLKQMGADRILAIHTDARGDGVFTSSNVVDISMRSLEIMGKRLNRENEKNAAYVLHVVGSGAKLLDIGKIPQSIQLGYEKAKEMMPRMLEELYLK